CMRRSRWLADDCSWRRASSSDAPTRRRASAYARSGGVPRATRYSTRLAMSACNSSSASRLVARRFNSGSWKRRRIPGRRSNDATVFPLFRAFVRENRGDGVELVDEARGFGAKVGPSGRRDPIVSGTAAVLRHGPLGGDEPALLQPVQRLEQRGIVDFNASGGALVEPGRDLERVHRRPGQRFEHERVERASEHGHANSLLLVSKGRYEEESVQEPSCMDSSATVAALRPYEQISWIEESARRR